MQFHGLLSGSQQHIHLMAAYADHHGLSGLAGELFRHGCGCLDPEAAAPQPESAVLFLHRSIDEVHGRVAHEVGYKQVGGLVVEHLGGIELLDASVIQDGNLVCHGHGLLLIVGYDDGGNAQILLDAADLVPDLDLQTGIQVGHGLVQQQDLRLLDQRTGHGN